MNSATKFLNQRARFSQSCNSEGGGANQNRKPIIDAFIIRTGFRLKGSSKGVLQGFCTYYDLVVYSTVVILGAIWDSSTVCSEL